MEVFKKILSLQVVIAMSIGLLMFIGISESYRVTSSMLLTNVCNQAQLLTESIETNLKLGVPIEYQGFALQADKLALQSKQIETAKIIINSHNTARSSQQEEIELTCDMTDKTLAREINIDWQGLLDQKNQLNRLVQYRIILTLEDKISQVAQLVITPKDGLFSQTVNIQFRPVVILALLLIVIVPIIISLIQSFSSKHSILIQKGLYHLAFLFIGAVIIYVMITLYSTGIKEQSSSMARSLGSRLSESVKLGFDIDKDFRGIDTLLDEYRPKKLDISHVYLLNKNNIVESSIDDKYSAQNNSKIVNDCAAGSISTDEDEFITTCKVLGGSDYQIVVKTPWSKVYARLWKAIRNILLLFVASILLSNGFLDVLLSIQKQLKGNNSKTPPIIRHFPEPDLHHLLQLVRSVFTLGILMEAINLSFLPAYFTNLFSDGNYSVSILFGVYFICFAFSLIPAGRWAETHSLRNMMLLALTLSAAGLVGLAYTQEYTLIALLRGLAGVGQGILFIAVQSYLLQLENQQSNLRGTDQLVISFNVSTISGAAIGALLMPQLGEQRVFLIGAVIGLICFIYCLLMLKDLRQTKKIEPSTIIRDNNHQSDLWFKIKKLATDIEFYKSIVLIGFPTKALYVGVLIFFLPIYLTEQNFDTDLIGQILVFYYFGVLSSTLLLGRLKLLQEQKEFFLFLGSLGSGIGLIIISSSRWLQQQYSVSSLPALSENIVLTLIILCGVLLIGLSHGFIHAPIVSHVVRSKNALLVGKATTAATYRFIERLGHVSGPVLASIFLLNSDGTTNIESLRNIGYFVIFCGVLFVFNKHHFSKNSLLLKEKNKTASGATS